MAALLPGAQNREDCQQADASELIARAQGDAPAQWRLTWTH